MKQICLILLSILFAINVSVAQNVDSFTVSNPNPILGDLDTLINLSTNCTYTEWIINGRDIVGIKGYPFDSVAVIGVNDVGCYKVSLVIGRGTKYDTITQNCAIKVPKVLFLLGKNPDTVNVFSSYADPFVSIDSNAILPDIIIVKKGKVDTNIIGKYHIVYYMKEKNSPKISDSVERIVYVVDRVPPLINLKGYSLIQIDRLCSFKDPGIAVSDNYWSSFKIHRSGSVDSSKLGFDTLYYWAEDGSGNLSGKVMLVVQVVNVRPPYIEKTSVEIPVFSKYTPEFKINHACCELKDIEVFTLGKVDTAKIGTYTIKTWLKDCRGFVSDTTTQLVHVVDKIPPVIQLLSKYNNNTIYNYDTIHFNPLDSIKVTDNYDPKPKVYLTGTYYSVYLKNFKKGQYTIIFNAEDQSGNKAIPVTFYEFVLHNSIPEYYEKVFTIFPNPSNGTFKLDITNPELAGFARVLDMTGKQILTIINLQQNNEITLPETCQGMYILQVVTQKRIFSELVYFY